MKALLLKDYKELEVTEFPVPEIGPDDILVQVRACGICGSDIHGYDGSSGRRIPPLVMVMKPQASFLPLDRESLSFRRVIESPSTVRFRAVTAGFVAAVRSICVTTEWCWEFRVVSTAVTVRLRNMWLFQSTFVTGCLRT